MCECRHGPQFPGGLAGFVFTVTLILNSFAPMAFGGALGLVSDNGSKRVTLFDAGTDVVTASIDASPGRAVGDCALSSDERVGVASSSGAQITFLDIDRSAPEPVNHSTPVRISNLGVDMALSPDDAFLVLAGGGALQQPLSVIDTALRREVATARPFVDHTSVEFCDNGILLVTTSRGRHYAGAADNALYGARLGVDGAIELQGNRISTGAQPNNSACAPGSLIAVLLDREGGITSFSLPDFEYADQVRTRGAAAAVAAVFSRDGRRLYVRTTGSVEAYEFDPVRGAMKRDWIRDAPASLAYFGMEQIALHPEGSKLYVDGGAELLVLDPVTGYRFGAIAMADTTGICFANAPVVPGNGRVARVAGGDAARTN